MTMKIRYSKFKDQIDVDAFEAAIGFTPFSTDRGNDTGHCVFPANHANGDTTGKFAIHRDKLVYNCFVCGGGSLLSLAMELYDFDVEQASHWLYQFATGVDTRNDVDFRDYLLGILTDVQERADTMPYFNARVLDRFSGPIDYFRTRGIADDVIADYRLCYSEHCMKPAPLKQTGDGLVKIDEDYFGPTAVFPHYWQGRLVGWQHRWMDWNEGRTQTPRWLPKYTNTTDFPKIHTLFNYDEALKARELICVVESVPTALFLISNGFPAVAYFGSKPTDAQLRLLRRFSQGVILCPDNDKVGDTMLSSSTSYLERYIPVYHTEKTVELGPKSDLGDYAQTKNASTNLCDHIENRTTLASTIYGRLLTYKRN